MNDMSQLFSFLSQPQVPTAGAPAAGMDKMKMAQLALSMMGSGQQPAAPQMQPMPQMQQMQQMQPTMAGQQASQFLQQYAPMGGMQQQNDEMMRQRMQGLMAMLGGQ
jgi:hypothetical protein